jgi:hypothetical protein
MAGFGALSDVPFIENAQIKMYRDGEWQMAADPLHNEHPRDGIGLGMSFADSVQRATNVEIGLIPCAISGTSIKRWIPEGDLYQRAVKIAQKALPAGELKGILWLQGESDAYSEASAVAHYPKFVHMVNQLREDLHAENVPILAGKIGDFLPKKGEFAFASVINEGYEQAGEDIPQFSLVDSSGLAHVGDHVHFDAKSQRIIGERFAAMYLSKV